MAYDDPRRDMDQLLAACPRTRADAAALRRRASEAITLSRRLRGAGGEYFRIAITDA